MIRKRILIVDDEIGSTRLLKANLELTRLYEVRVENRPENAVPAARQFRPHMVLLDVIMPHMSGMSVASALLAEPELKAVAIGFLTAANDNLPAGHGDPLVRRLPRLSKPAAMEEILQFLEETLSSLPVSHAAVAARAGQFPGG